VHHQAVKQCVKPYKKTGSSNGRSLVMQAKGSKPVCYPTKFQIKHPLVQTFRGPIPTSYEYGSMHRVRANYEGGGPPLRDAHATPVQQIITGAPQPVPPPHPPHPSQGRAPNHHGGDTGRVPLAGKEERASLTRPSAGGFAPASAPRPCAWRARPSGGRGAGPADRTARP
jgi:hypothetical protein